MTQIPPQRVIYCASDAGSKPSRLRLAELITHPALARGRPHRVKEDNFHLAKEAFVQTRIIGSRAGTGSQISSRSDTLAAAIFAALLGAFVIWGVGFSRIDVLHNAAHDTRHSTGFPCH
jgi:cobalt transporter subunit CbtB